MVTLLAVHAFSWLTAAQLFAQICPNPPCSTDDAHIATKNVFISVRDGQTFGIWSAYLVFSEAELFTDATKRVKSELPGNFSLARFQSDGWLCFTPWHVS